MSATTDSKAGLWNHRGVPGLNSWRRVRNDVFFLKHFCDFCGLEIEKNESASILWVLPARMCVRSLLLKGCRSCTAPLDVEIWAIVRPPASWKKSFHAILSQLRKLSFVRSSRLGWLLRQVYGGWYRTWSECHGWPWNVKSTIRKVEHPQHKPGSPWSHCWLPTIFTASLSCTAQAVPRNILDHGCRKVARLAQPPRGPQIKCQLLMLRGGQM